MRDGLTKNTAWAAAAAAGLALALAPAGLAQTNRYVVKGNAGAPPFTNWADAAPSIQDAISACSSGDVVWVRAATYDEGGVTNWPAGSVLTSRVAVTTAYVTVRSENNDPATTIIKGRFDTGLPGAEGTVTNGPSAVRGVYLADKTRLIGFTITNGATLTNGDIHGAGIMALTTSPVVSNCVIIGNAAHYANLGSGYGGGSRYGTLYNCVIEGNVAGFAGGASYSTLYDCSVISNVTRQSGAGVAYCTLQDCVLIGNRALANGGGAHGGTLIRCTLSGNRAVSGGGAYDSALTSCILSNNNASVGGGARLGTLSNCWLVANYSSYGGGAYEATLYNCLIMGNDVRGYQMHGGGAGNSRLFNCTVVGNRAGNISNTNTPAPGGGGVSGCGLVNSIVYYNQDAQYGYHNYRASTNQYSCTTPEDPGWTEADHNTAEEPRFMANGSGYGTNDFAAGNYQLRGSSPCVNAGTNGSWTAGVDLAGNPRIRYGVVDMGAFECIVNRGVMIRVR